MCENQQKLELQPEPQKRELRGRNHTHKNQELQSWSHVHEKKSSGARAVSFLRQSLTRGWNLQIMKFGHNLVNYL